MTQEEIGLLTKDICTRLPYGVKVDAYSYSTPQTLYSIDVFRKEYTLENDDSGNLFVGFDKHIFSNIKPYLRPMSSMTEKEKEELRQEHIKDEKLFAECLTKAANGDSSIRGKVVPHFAADWCNKNHFDYRGLISMGLALEAPEGMYNTKTK